MLASIVHTMQTELDNLEKKLATLLAMAQQLRSENHQLRQEVAAMLSDNRTCKDKVEQATTHLERLLAQIPEGAL